MNQLDTASNYKIFIHYYLNTMPKDALGLDPQVDDIEAGNVCLQFPLNK